MRHTAKIVSLIAGVAVMALAGAASATSITWTTTAGNCLSGYTCNSSQASFLGSDGTTVVTAKAWSYNPSTGAIVASTLGIYSPGLGVLSPYDGSHTVDNNGYKDFVAFYFSEEVDINAVYLNTYGDTDMTAWIGTVPGACVRNARGTVPRSPCRRRPRADRLPGNRGPCPRAASRRPAQRDLDVYKRNRGRPRAAPGCRSRARAQARLG